MYVRRTQGYENTRPGHVKISADIRTWFVQNASQRRYCLIYLGLVYKYFAQWQMRNSSQLTNYLVFICDSEAMAPPVHNTPY
jgi:hypothetical protein